MFKVTVRKAQFQDIETVLVIEQESSGSWNFNQFIQELNYEFSLFLVAELEDKVIGYIIAWKVADEIQLNNIAVSGHYRRQGVGYLLLSEISKKENMFSSIVLEVRSRNINAINFYTDNGFTKTGIRKNYYTDDDALLMEKKL